jgi:four helix bundle protein
MPIKTYKDLNVYKEAYKLALEVSRTTRKLTQHEQFELGKQLRRAARSVPANIVEGWAKRASALEFKRYLSVAIGPRDESKFWLELSRDESYLTAADAEALLNRFNLVGAMLKSLWKNWKTFAIWVFFAISLFRYVTTSKESSLGY